MGLISNNPSAFALTRAKNLKIPDQFIPYQAANRGNFFEKANEFAKKLKADVIALAGFLLLVRDPLLKSYSGRILNTHPALLPLFGGKGMYGDRVHQAVIHAGHKESGVTIHLVDEVYDDGEILAVHKVPVIEGDDYRTLSERVRDEEKRAYPEVLNQFVTSLGFS